MTKNQTFDTNYTFNTIYAGVSVTSQVLFTDVVGYYNWWGSPGNTFGNADNRYDMPVVMGTATSQSARSSAYLGLHHASSFSGNAPVNGPAFLGPTFNGIDDYWINPAGAPASNNHPSFNEFAVGNNVNGAADYINQTVLRTGLNGYLQDESSWGSLASNGGTILPSLGIDGHPNANDTAPHLGKLLDVDGFYQGTNIITLSHSGLGS